MAIKIVTASAAAMAAGLLLALTAVAVPAATPPAAAAAPGSKQQPTEAKPLPVLSKESREKLAVLHEQMAACLRSDKSIADCHAEMRAACSASLNNMGCPSMGMGGAPAMGMHHMMQTPPPKPAGQ
jgi:hypothetical protein